MVYSETLDLTSTNKLIVSMNRSASNYQTNIHFSYIYYTNNYVGSNVAAMFKAVTETLSAFIVPYQKFAFTPSSKNVMFAFRQYYSVSIPFLNCQPLVDYNFITGANPSMKLGYVFSAAAPAKFNSDIFFFNTSASICPDQQFLYYIQLYETLPYGCLPCHSSCLHCSTNSTVNPLLTDQYSCTACTWLSYLNASADSNGNCLCLLGLSSVNGVCS